jgi:hypothetical protein
MRENNISGKDTQRCHCTSTDFALRRAYNTKFCFDMTEGGMSAVAKPAAEDTSHLHARRMSGHEATSPPTPANRSVMRLALHEGQPTLQEGMTRICAPPPPPIITWVTFTRTFQMFGFHRPTGTADGPILHVTDSSSSPACGYIQTWAVPYLRRLVAGFPPRRPGFDPGSSQWARFPPGTSVFTATHSSH